MIKKFKNRFTFEDIKGIKTLNQLAHILAEPVEKLQILAATAQNYYKPFTTKNGKKRIIDRPVGELKNIQKKIVDRILKLCPLSEITYGAVEGKSTRDNALNHVRKRVVVRMDLSDCFHNVKAEWVYRCYRKQFNFSKSVAKLLTKLSTYNKSVPVGSPLSSMLVNVVLDPLWGRVHELATQTSNVASVWVDDVIFSGNHAHELVQPIKELINQRGLKIGWHKLDIMRSKDRQEATGCSLNSAVGIPKRKRILYARNIIEKKRSGLNASSGHIGYAKYIRPTQGKQLAKLADRINAAK